MSETLDHIDQLRQWWENAEVPTSATLPSDGDRIIIRYNSEWYEIATAVGDAAEHETADTRILARAPKTTPAWHDAVAVIAHTDSDVRQVWVREGSTWWAEGTGLDAYELRDVTPLIEAKVTDEMVEAARQEVKDRTGVYWARSHVSRMLAAALGIEEES